MEESLACAALRRAGRDFLPSIAIRTRWGAGARSRRADATLIASEQARAARPNRATPYHARRSGRGRRATSWLCDRVTLPRRAPPRHLARRARVQRRHAECGAKLRNFICFANSEVPRAPRRAPRGRLPSFAGRGACVWVQDASAAQARLLCAPPLRGRRGRRRASRTAHVFGRDLAAAARKQRRVSGIRARPVAPIRRFL